VLLFITGDPAVYVMQCDALSQHLVRRESISGGAAKDVSSIIAAARLGTGGRGLGNNRQVGTHLWLFGSKSQAAHGTAGSLRPFVEKNGGITMEDTFLIEMRQRLQAEKAMLQDELIRLRAVTGTDDAFSEHAGLGNHMADDASELFEQEKNLSLQYHTAELLSKVEAALHRMDTGTYGRCEKCGSPIDRARLEVLPYATLCMACKARQEKV